MQISHEMPWHSPVWAQLRQAIQGQRLPHALLLTGPAGVGKGLFARQLSQFLLCENASPEKLQSCGQCPACIKTLNGAHPDFRRFSPQEGKRELVMEDIRNLLKFIQLSSQIQNGYKIAIIEPAEVMNRNAANALLKTLEEPPAGRLIMLVTASVGRIPATIRSRCRILRFTQPQEAQARDWLATESGRPIDNELLENHDHSVLAALEAIKNPDNEGGGEIQSAQWQKQWLSAVQHPDKALKVAEEWANAESQLTIMRWLMRENLKGLRKNLGAETKPCDNVFGKADINTAGILDLNNKINKLIRLSETTVNSRLSWETFLLDCHKIVSGASKERK